MMQKLMNRKNKKGFTLIELIVVIAIIAILAAIAVPRFTGLANASKVKADATTAQLLVSSARLQEIDTGTAVAAASPAVILVAYATVTTPQSGGTFAISGGGVANYVITWTPTKAGTNNVAQTVTENTPFVIKP